MLGIDKNVILDNKVKVKSHIKLLHATLLVEDIDRAIRFYHDILGLQPSAQRPDLGYPGVWFEVGEQQLHLMQLPNPDPSEGRPAHPGRDRHVAFALRDFEALQKKLDSLQISYSMSKSGRKALFIRDPDGNGLELIGDD